MSTLRSYDPLSRYRAPRYSKGWTVLGLRADIANANRHSTGRRRAA